MAVSKRLFIAINFNDETRSQLIGLCDELRCKSQSGRFSAPENLHLTLAFLGACDLKQEMAAESVLKAIKFEAFDITIDSIGRFKRTGGDIWWAGVHASNALIALQRELTEKLNNVGFDLDTHKYKPHITLSREVVTDITPWTIKPFGETVHKIELMNSERIKGKLTYTPLACSK